MEINLIGTCDKRAITYSLLKILSKEGPVALFTTNHSLLHLLPEMTPLGLVNDIFIYVGDNSVGEVWSLANEMEIDRTAFRHIIYETEDHIEPADIYIHIKGDDVIPEWQASLLEDEIPDGKYGKIRINYSINAEPKDSDYTEVKVEPSWLEFFGTFEATGEFDKFMTKSVPAALDEWLSGRLNMNAREIEKALRRG